MSQHGHDAVFIKPATGPCQIHDWPLEGLGMRLIDALREAHGKGGVNACVECIGRAKADADEQRRKILEQQRGDAAG